METMLLVLVVVWATLWGVRAVIWVLLHAIRIDAARWAIREKRRRREEQE